jgi:mRNA-degrading endonuclease RelE of RelBE toxin-antitoxin system
MNVVLTQPVEIALRSLSDEDRRKMAAWLDHLKNWENDPHVRKQSHKLDSTEGVYVLRTSTDLRIFFSLQEDQIVVLDIARKGTIMSFGPLAEQGSS